MNKVYVILLAVLIILFIIVVGIAISIFIDEKAIESVGHIMIPVCTGFALLFLVGIAIAIYLIKKK